MVIRGDGGETRTMSPVIEGELLKMAGRQECAPSQIVMGSPGRSRRRAVSDADRRLRVQGF